MADETTGGSGIPNHEQGDTPEVITTPEGFKVHGRNETSLIRSLTSLNGTPITDLEAIMRPKEISNAGFLGKDESLTEVLAEDNDTVLEMGLTHQQLGDFLHRFDRAPNDMSGIFGTTFNDQRFGHFATTFMGSQESPFDDGTATASDHTIINLETGAMIGFSGLLPELIHRYGFYEGKGTPYRIDPKKIAEIAGFIPLPEDDPVVQLVKNRDAQVEITTRDQFIRINGLMSAAGEDILSGQNYRFIPEDSASLLHLLGRFGRSPYDTTEETEAERAHRDQIAARIDTRNLTPQTLKQEFMDDTTLIDIIPASFPQLKQVVLDGIEQLSVPCSPDGRPSVFSTEEFLEKVLKRDSEKVDGEDNPHREYYGGLLGKLARDPETIGFLIKGATRLKEQPELIATFDRILPTLKTDVIALYAQQGAPVSNDMTLEQLIDEQKKRDEHEKMINHVASIVHERGGVEDVQTEDAERFVAVMDILKDAPDHQFTHDEKETLRRLKIDSALIPYAFKAVSRLNYSWDTASVIFRLYNGSAKIEQELDHVLSTLPDNFDSQARTALEALIINQESDYARKFDLGAFTRKITVRLANVDSGEDQGQAAQVTENDVLNDYFEIAIPEFSDFLANPLVKKSAADLARDPLSTHGRIDARLDTTVLESLPEIEMQDRFQRTKQYRKLTIGEDTYFIGEREIIKGEPKAGAQTLSLYTENIVGLNTEMMY